VTPGRTLRMTRQREVILGELKKLDSHPTADELYARVRKRLPRISLGTVYRNLDVLSELGVVHKLEFAGKQRRYDGCCEEHYHVRCLGCGRIDDVPAQRSGAILRQIRRKLHYEIIGHRLEFVGYCPRCARRRGTNGKGVSAVTKKR